MKPKTLLSQLVDQYQERHQKPPEQIVVHPAALVVLAARKSLGPLWNGIPVLCQEITPQPPEKEPSRLGIAIVDGSIQGFDV